MDASPRSLRVDQVAKALGCSPSNIYVLAERGELEAFRVGIGTKRGGLRIVAESVNDFILRRCSEFKDECAGIFPSTSSMDSTTPAENSTLKPKRGTIKI